MPKISKSTAPTHQLYPGYVEVHEQEIGGWTVSVETDFIDLDFAPFFKGGPDDRCQARHLGYVVKGRFGVRRADGVEEVFEAGDAFVIEPGHTPFSFAGVEFVTFTPTEQARAQTAVVLPNIVAFAEEHGLEIPAEALSS